MLRFFLSSSFVLLCSALLENAVLSNLMFLPAIPDISLLCIIYFAVHNGTLCGEGSGFISGIILDFLSAGPFGLNCLLRPIIGYIAGLFYKIVNIEGFLLPLFLGFLGTLLKALLLFVISLLYPNAMIYFNPFSWQFLIQLGFNTILAPFVFMFLNIFKKSLVLKPETNI